MLKSQPSTTVQLSVGLMLGVSIIGIFHPQTGVTTFRGSKRAFEIQKFQYRLNCNQIAIFSDYLFFVQGALVAAMGDLSFNALGYIVIFFNDLFTALNGVILKRTSEGEGPNNRI